MRILDTYNPDRISNGNVTMAALLGTTFFSDPFPGVIGDEAVLFARVELSWTGITGGDATSRILVRTHIYPKAVNPVQESPGGQLYTGAARTAFNTIAVSQGWDGSGGAPLTLLNGVTVAANAESVDVAFFNVAGMNALTPFPKWWTIRLAPSGTAYGATGSISVYSVTFFG